MSRVKLSMLRRREPLRLGFLPVSDCAPLVYAHEAGLFAKYELEVELQRQSCWSGLADKVIYGELDAAHVPASLPFLANLNSDSDPCACVTGLVLSLEGVGIVLSRKLWDSGVKDPVALREQVHKVWGKRTLTFAVSLRFSSHEFLLRQWFSSAGIVPEVELRIIAVPPEQMFPTLKLGYIDGYCTNEPWVSVAVEAGFGVSVAGSGELAPRHPEKVLMVRQSFAAGRAEEHERLLAALLESCVLCEQAQSHERLVQMLSHPHYVDAPGECIASGLPLPRPLEGEAARRPGRAVFHGGSANAPSDDKARWLMMRLDELLQKSVFKSGALERTPVLKNSFRGDVFARVEGSKPESARPVEPLQTPFASFPLVTFA